MVEISQVEGDELLKLSESLQEKSEQLYNYYQKVCAPALNMSTECLQTTGLNTSELISTFDEIYKKIHNRLDEFAAFLSDTVLAEYNAVQEAIVSNFNRTFGEEMAGILGISYQGPIAADKIYPIEDGSIGHISIPANPGVPITIPKGENSISPIRGPIIRDDIIQIPKQPEKPIEYYEDTLRSFGGSGSNNSIEFASSGVAQVDR